MENNISPVLKPQISYQNNVVLNQKQPQVSTKSNELQQDAFLKNGKKIATGSAIVALIGITITTVIAHKRGKAINTFNGNNGKFFSNISEGVKSFFGKNKEFYNLNIKNKVTNVTVKPVTHQQEGLLEAKPNQGSVFENSIEAPLNPGKVEQQNNSVNRIPRQEQLPEASTETTTAGVKKPEIKVNDSANITYQLTPEEQLAEFKKAIKDKSDDELAEIINELRAERKKLAQDPKICFGTDKTPIEAIDKKLQMIAGSSYSNPKTGEIINFAKSQNTQTVDCVRQNELGLYVKDSFILDRDNMEYVITGTKLYQEDMFTEMARERQFSPLDKVLENWKNDWETKYEFASEQTKSRFPSAKAWAEFMSDPKRLISKQLEKLQKVPPTTTEHYLYRGINLKMMDKNGNNVFNTCKTGEIIVPDIGVSCTTPNPSYAIKHYMDIDDASTALLRIKIPTGSRLAGLYKDGFEEFHMPSMSSYKVLGQQKIGRATMFDLEYIMPF